MLPIHLDWQRPIDGAEIIFTEERWGPGPVIKFRSDRVGPVAYDVSNLEVPVALALLNADDDEQVVSFVARFGIPKPLGRDDRIPLELVKGLRDDVAGILDATVVVDPLRRAAMANDLLRQAILHPTFEYSCDDARLRLVHRPDTLESLILFECAVAIDVGASLTRCARCGAGFLVGPLTGRRSHAVYCSDRCRVAAMRARNVANGAK